MQLDQHYVDPRLVALYDLENSRGPDTDFYGNIAADLNPRTIVDLGCGTGLLTRELAIDGPYVVGLDPSMAMLAHASRQPGADRVRWVAGYSGVLGAGVADLVTMTGHVAQIFLEDDDWASALRDIHAALRPGGHLAFESRNPDDGPWERWNLDATYARFDSIHGPVASWIELVSVGADRVRFEGHNVFESTGQVVVAPSELRFRTLGQLTESLERAGFAIERVYGDWHRGPVSAKCRELIFLARRD